MFNRKIRVFPIFLILKKRKYVWRRFFWFIVTVYITQRHAIV